MLLQRIHVADNPEHSNPKHSDNSVWNLSTTARQTPAECDRTTKISIAVDEAGGVAVLADGMVGTTPAKSPAAWRVISSRPSWALVLEAAQNATDNDVKRAMDICVDNANRAIFNAANPTPHLQGMGTTLFWACSVQDVSDGAYWRLARLSISQRSVAADHERPFVTAGTDRCWHSDA